MNYDSVVAYFVALFFVAVGIRLLRVSQRTGQSPERLLGIYFVATGLSYGVWQVPVMLNVQAAGGPIDLFAWTLYCVGVVPFLMFVQQVFRPDTTWAKTLVAGCTVALLVGMMVWIAAGQDYYRIDNPWFWPVWVGFTVPCLWMSAEAFISFDSAKRRVRIGLCDRVVANRYLLFGLFGVFQALACATDLAVLVDFEKNARFSSGLNLSTLLVEMAGIVVLFLAFFPPQFYRNRFADPVDDAPHTSEVG